MIFIRLALAFFVLRNKKMIYFSFAFSLTEKNGLCQKQNYVHAKVNWSKICETLYTFLSCTMCHMGHFS